MRYLDDMDDMFDRLLDLSDQQRGTIKERFRFLMSEYRRRLWMYALLFYCLRITMTVGSLTVPALLSLSVAPAQQDMLRWLTWGISLAVTTANGLITLFKVDKRFFLLHTVAERLRTETWQFLSLAGRYSGHYGGYKPTHANQYVYYTTQLERIRMRHIEEEFVRQADMGDANHGQHVASTTGSTTTTATTTTPDRKENPTVVTQTTTPQTLATLDVPSPADQAILTTPPPRFNNQNQQQPLRRESTSTIGSSDDAIVHVTDSAETSVPMPGRSGPLSSTGTQGEPLLLQTSELSDVAPEPRGATVQSGPLQSKSADSGNA